MAKSYYRSGPGHKSHHNNKDDLKLVNKLIPQPVSESIVGSTGDEKDMISKRIHKTMPHIKLTEMQTVKNSYLEAQYLLKKEEYKSRYGRPPQEMLLFHITAASNVKSIVMDNFDWRRVSRGKFGRGTSFSGDAGYANRYANVNIGQKRAIIITKVLVCKTILGSYGTKIPYKQCDTTTGNNGKVYVKFSDNEMLPIYIVYFNSDVNHSNKKISQNKQQTYDEYSSYEYDEIEEGDYEEEEYCTEEEEYEEEYDESYEEGCEEEEYEDEEEEYEDEEGYEGEEYEDEEGYEEKEECEDEEDCEEEEYEDEEDCEEEECEEEADEHDYYDEESDEYEYGEDYDEHYYY